MFQVYSLILMYFVSSNTEPAIGEDVSTTDPQERTLERLDFVQLFDWDERNSYDEETPTRIHYSIEWKVTLANRVVSKDTEQDLVLVPTAYWHMILKPKFENFSEGNYPRMGTLGVTIRTSLYQ